MKKLLWLDDIRNPSESDWLTYNPINHDEVIWVKLEISSSQTLFDRKKLPPANIA